MKKKILLAIMIIALSTLAFCVISASAKTEVSKDKKSFTITPVNVEYGKTVILALYNGEKFVEMQSAVYTGEEIPFTTTKDYTNAKVMVWDDLTSLKPVCEVENVKIPTSGDSGETEEPEENEILIYSLLDDGTYGVMAGADAATQATITIPESYNNIAVTQILDEGFMGMSNLQIVNIPDSITAIGTNAFSACSSLSAIKIPQSVTFIGAYAFYGSGLVTAVFDDYSNWELEEKVQDSSLFNYTGISEWGIRSKGRYGSSTYYSTCDLSDVSVAAKALKTSITLKVYSVWAGETTQSHTKSVALYTKNWIKQ